MGKQQCITVGTVYSGVGGLHDYAHVRVNQWPVGLSCLSIGQFVKN